MRRSSKAEWSRESAEQAGAWGSWLKAKRLKYLEVSRWASPRELARFLEQGGCDLATWGLEKRTKSVETLYRELSSARGSLCETRGTTDEEASSQIVRCVAALRVRVVNEEGDTLVRELVNQNGDQIHMPLSGRLRIGESPFKAAEKLLRNLTGLTTFRSSRSSRTSHLGKPLSGIAEGPSTSDRDHDDGDDDDDDDGDSDDDDDDDDVEDLEHGSGKDSGRSWKIVYEPLQFENPLEYESLSSSTYPTLSTMYRVNVLTLRLNEKRGVSAQEFVDAAAENSKSLRWVSRARARLVYEHLDLHSRRRSRARAALESSLGTQRRQEHASYGALAQEKMLFGLGDAELEGGQGETLRESLQDLLETTQAGIAFGCQSKRFLGPASATHESATPQMASVLVDVLAQLQAHWAALRHRRVLGFLQHTNWASNVNAHGWVDQASSYVRNAQRGWTFAPESGTARWLLQRLAASKLNLETIFTTVSYDSFGNLTPLADCKWFVTIKQLWMAQSHSSLGARPRLGYKSIELFRMWLDAANLDTDSYTDDMLHKLLQETIEERCDLVFHPETRRLQRVLRLAKVLIYDTLSDDDNGDDKPATRGGILTGRPQISRRLVYQQISGAARDYVAASTQTSVRSWDMDFHIVLNQKAPGSTYMLDVVEKVVERYFAATIVTESAVEGESGQPVIRSVFMLEPTLETNVSPSFPGLTTIYYIHQFWVRLEGIPLGRNFYTMAPSHAKTTSPQAQDYCFWMWIDVRSQALNDRTEMLKYFTKHPSCLGNLRKVMQGPRPSLAVNPQADADVVEATYVKLFVHQVHEACKWNDPHLVDFALGELWATRTGRQWDVAKKTKILLDALAVALNSNAIVASHALLAAFVQMALGTPGAAIKGARRMLPATSALSPRAKRRHREADVFLTSFNTVLIIASLINARPTVEQMKETLVARKIEKLSAAPLCVLAAAKLGHAKMLRILLEMTPHFANGPFYPERGSHAVPSESMHLRPLWEDKKRMLRKFGITKEAETLLLKCGHGLTLFVPGYDGGGHKAAGDDLATVSRPSRLSLAFGKAIGHIADVWCGALCRLWPRRRRQVRQDPHHRVEADTARTGWAIEPYGWDRLLAEICPLENARQRVPLANGMTQVLGTALSFCPPDHSLFRTYLEAYLVSVVNVCWNDATIFGYELESQRIIVEFLETCLYPFHVALLMTQILRKHAVGTSYYSTEFGVLYRWVSAQCMAMLDTCASQEEANAVLYEQIRVEPEETTSRSFGRDTAPKSSSLAAIPKKGSDLAVELVHQVIDPLERAKNHATGFTMRPPTETSALYMAISCHIEGVVASKWFQGTNENQVWFYEWWRPDRFPAVYERYASSSVATFVITLVILVELVIMMPVWCLTPFSVKLSVWRDRLAVNSAYFKFLSVTLLHCGFVTVVCINALSTSPLHVEMTEVRPISGIELVMYAWALGLAASELQAVYFNPREYLKSAVNLIDCLYLICLGCAFSFRVLALTLPQDRPYTQSVRWFLDDGSWNTFAAVSYSEMCLAAGSLLAVYRLVHLSSFHQRLGPLYESIIKMGGDLASYAFLLVILFFGNALCLVIMLRRYDGGKGYYIDSLGGTESESESTVSMTAGLQGAMIILGESLFSGEIPGDDSVVSMTTVDTVAFYTLVVLHLLVVVIVGQNLLVAMLNLSFEKTQDAANVVYLNGRMQLINDYAGLPVVPPPLNLVTIPFEVLALAVNHVRFGNSRHVVHQVALESRRKTTMLGLSLSRFSGPESASASATSAARLEALTSKRMTSVNHSMRRIRVAVMRAYFARVRATLRMQQQQSQTASSAAASSTSGVSTSASASSSSTSTSSTSASTSTSASRSKVASSSSSSSSSSSAPPSASTTPSSTTPSSSSSPPSSSAGGSRTAAPQDAVLRTLRAAVRPEAPSLSPAVAAYLARATADPASARARR